MIEPDIAQRKKTSLWENKYVEGVPYGNAKNMFTKREGSLGRLS